EPRCDFARDACREERPALRQIGDQHLSRCRFAEEIDPQRWQPPQDIIPLAPAENGQRDDVLQVSQLKSYYRQGDSSMLSVFGLGKKEYVKAVDGVSFALPRGRTLGVVGESGCGKSTLIKTIIGLEDMSGGKAEFVGFDLQHRTSQRDLSLIRELQMVFQNPDATMNPHDSTGNPIA